MFDDILANCISNYKSFLQINLLELNTIGKLSNAPLVIIIDNYVCSFMI